MADHDPVRDEPDSDQVEVRKEKLARLRAAGVEPYPNDFKPTQSASEIASKFADASEQALAEAPKDLCVAGRIVAIRRMGKASFFHIQDRRGRLQVYIQQNRVGEEVYNLFRTLDVGDIVGLSGYLFRTRTRELTLEAEGLRLLAKCLRPLPEKWTIRPIAFSPCLAMANSRKVPTGKRRLQLRITVLTTFVPLLTTINYKLQVRHQKYVTLTPSIKNLKALVGLYTT